MPDRTEFVTVSIACGDAEEAKTIAGRLVEQKLAACAQILPTDSVYRWRGKLEREAEYPVLAKTLTAALPALEKLVVAHHGYEVPEILALPVAWAHGPYAEWLREAVQTPDG